ncbi:hypothetical protein N9159_00800 [bacterium]|nr:hypothetical protein [bacterium]
MKITLDLPSVLTGGAVALVLGLVAGFTPQVTQLTPQRPATAVPLNGPLRPAARDIVMLEAKNDGCPGVAMNAGFDSPLFTVPPGKILVVTALSATGAYGTTLLGNSNTRGYYFEVDGALRRQEVNFEPSNAALNAPYSFDLGIPLQEGQTIRVLRSNYDCDQSVRLHGYLEDA